MSLLLALGSGGVVFSECICTVHLHKAAYAWHPPKPLQIMRPDPYPAAVIRAVHDLRFSSCNNRQELHQAL